MKKETVFICPVCGEKLEREEKSFYCRGEKKHCYDIASSGYVNLLPPGRKGNKKAGDDGMMLKARERFLKTGYYDKISDGAVEAALKFKSGEIGLFADAGCGEGYHTVRIFEKLREKNKDVCGVGFDASKNGAASGAKKAGSAGYDLSFAAANIFKLPLPDCRADAIFSMFAPVPDGEAYRILKDDGILVVCSSGSRHLWEMREIIYGEPRLSPPLSRVPEGFELCGASGVSYEIELCGDEIKDLFTMTPFYYRCPKEGREKLLSKEKLITGVSAEYKVYRKK